MSDEREAGLPSSFDLAQLRKQAKDLKRAVRAGDAATIARVAQSHPKYAGRPPDRLVPEHMTLRDAHATLASEMGFGGWKELVRAAEDAAGTTTVRWATRLAAHVPLVVVAGGTPTVVDLMVEGAIARADCADGPVPGRAFVEGPDGESIGEVLVWVHSGRLSGLEYAWFTEQSPEVMPPAQRLRLE